jgi:hypothetical protein
MFVSSYNTYVHSNSSEKVQKEVQPSKNSYSRFASTQDKTTNPALPLLKKELPVSYISNYKVMNNQQKLQEQTQAQQNQKTKFTKISTLNSAKSAYTENSTLFTSLRKPKVTLNQTPALDTKLPQEALQAQEFIMKRTMLNTYIANDNYYKITA